MVGRVYAYVGASNHILDVFERYVEIGYAISDACRSLWLPLYAPLRKTERFKTDTFRWPTPRYFSEMAWWMRST